MRASGHPPICRPCLFATLGASPTSPGVAWMRPTRGLLLVVALLALIGSWVAPRAIRAADDPPVTCSELQGLGLIVSLTDRELTDTDQTHFCLIARPEDDTYTAFLPNVRSLDEFRVTKSTYAAAMTSKNYDVCRIGTW